jgi:hypothetical protein
MYEQQKKALITNSAYYTAHAGYCIHKSTNKSFHYKTLESNNNKILGTIIITKHFSQKNTLIGT